MDGPCVHVLYASQTGCAREVAERIGRQVDPPLPFAPPPPAANGVRGVDARKRSWHLSMRLRQTVPRTLIPIYLCAELARASNRFPAPGCDCIQICRACG
jgi:hypothetical protein